MLIWQDIDPQSTAKWIKLCQNCT